jgi:hypothetical protein
VIEGPELQLSIALKPDGEHWTWSLIDVGGDTVASGAAADRAIAERQLWRAYRAAQRATVRWRRGRAEAPHHHLAGA